jgi:hypothetical protein
MSKNYPQITQILGRDALRRVRFSKEQLHLVTKPSLGRSRSLAQDKSFTDAQEHIPIEICVICGSILIRGLYFLCGI